MTIAHLLDVFLKRTYQKKRSFHKVLICLSRPCCEGGLCSNESFSSFSIDCAKKDFSLKDRLSTLLTSNFFLSLRKSRHLEQPLGSVQWWIGASFIAVQISAVSQHFQALIRLPGTIPSFSVLLLQGSSFMDMGKILLFQAPEADCGKWLKSMAVSKVARSFQWKREVQVACTSAQMKPPGTERMFAFGSIIHARGFSAKPV